MAWLLRNDTLRELRAHARAGVQPTAEQRELFQRQQATALSGAPRNLRIAGDVAQINVDGLLTARPDLLAWLLGMGNTTYSSILESLAVAGADPSVRRVTLAVNSPGGQVGGLFDVLGALESFAKPITVRAAMACSAAYAIAALAGPITATSVASEFGSVGVAASIFVDEDVVDVTSTEAPNKRPDVTTEEGRAVVRAELDAIHELFADAIARGRKTTVARVNSEFGRGGVLLAGEAKRRGMIDHLPAGASSSPTKASATSAKGTKHMDINQLKAEYPAVFEAVLQQGRDEEHTRVASHLELANGSGDLAGALADIKSRAPVTSLTYSRHMSAGINRRDTAHRQMDSDAAGAVLNGATSSGGTVRDRGDDIADRMFGPPKAAAVR